MNPKVTRKVEALNILRDYSGSIRLDRFHELNISKTTAVNLYQDRFLFVVGQYKVGPSEMEPIYKVQKSKMAAWHEANSRPDKPRPWDREPKIPDCIGADWTTDWQTVEDFGFLEGSWKEDEDEDNSLQTMESDMNTNKMINCLYENLNAVQVRYEPNGKIYTYKTMENFEIDDLCVLYSQRGGFVVAKVVGTDSSLLEQDRKFEWVVQKVDVADYNSRVKREVAASEKISKMIREKRREESIEKIQDLLGGEEGVKMISEDLNAVVEEAKDE